MSLTRVDFGLQYFPQFTADRAIANANIYIGVADLDPETNPIQAYIVQEDGTQLAVPQPIRTEAGGVPTYQGSPVQVAVDSPVYSVKVKSSLGAQIYYVPNNTGLAPFTTDAEFVTYTPPGLGTFTTTAAEELDRGYINALRFTGVVADKVTDCYAGLQVAIITAYSLKSALYLPSAPSGFYYRISQTLRIEDMPDFVLFGDGTQSLIVNFNAAGQHAVVLDNSPHVRIRGIGVTAVTGSGSGIRFENNSHYFLGERIWMGWIDGDAAFDVVQSISGRLIGCSVEENNGYDPAGLTDPVRGDTKRAIWIRSQASGLNNEWNCTSFVIDGGGAGSNYTLQIGTPGGDQVESFYYQGLIQASFRAVHFAAARDVNIMCSHIEPPVGAQPDYLVRIEDSLNCSIQGRNIQGDTLIRNSENCGLRDARVFGINIETDCDNCFVENVRYGNSAVGPTVGKLIDQSLTSVIKDTVNSANDNYSIGNNLKWLPSRYLSNNMSQIVSTGGAVVAPCGFEKFGSYTPAVVDVGSPYGSGFQVNHTADFTQGFKVRLAPINQIRGRKVTVDSILFNQLVAGGGYVLMEVTGGAGAGTSGQESFNLNRSERLQITFNVPSDAATVDLIFTGINGARVNWISIDIFAEAHTKITTEDAAGAATATPDVSFNGGSNRGGYPLETVILGAGSNITDFVNPHVGKKFTLRFTASRTVVSSATLKLSGGGNFPATADDMLTLEYGSDNVFREVSRSVNA